MKNLKIILGTLVGFFIIQSLVTKIFAGILQRYIGTNVTKSFLLQAIFEVIILLLFIFVNRKFLKQKMLLEHYHYGKGFGLLGYSWFLLLELVLVFSLGIRKNSLSLVAIFMVLLLALLVGIAEEYIFRGLILGGLVSSGKSVGFALIVSSLLFACTHFVNLFHNSFYNVGLQVLYVIPMGFLIGLIYIKSNNIVYAIIFHAIQDFSSMVITGGQMNSTVATPQSVLVVYLIFGTLALTYYLTGTKQIALFKSRLQMPVSTDKIGN
ncbi:lysostaphin resistance A-like protein [Lactococcus sp.]|uniref:CPBP family intramembrane glutamic endopeptidase n=1 Tax=Lactococcus sp. TaxID=44273 RepID=UPI0035B0A1EF